MPELRRLHVLLLSEALDALIGTTYVAGVERIDPILVPLTGVMLQGIPVARQGNARSLTFWHRERDRGDVPGLQSLTLERLMPVKLKHGHAPGHVRDAFLDAVEAFTGWDAGEPEPRVDYEVDYEPRPVPISRMCGLLWNCTDIIPWGAVRDLEDVGVQVGRQTYAACARAMLADIKAAATHC